MCCLAWLGVVPEPYRRTNAARHGGPGRSSPPNGEEASTGEVRRTPSARSSRNVPSTHSSEEEGGGPLRDSSAPQRMADRSRTWKPRRSLIPLCRLNGLSVASTGSAGYHRPARHGTSARVSSCFGTHTVLLWNGTFFGGAMAGGWEWPPPQNPKTTLARSVSQGTVRPRPRGPGTSKDPHIHPTVWQGTCAAVRGRCGRPDGPTCGIVNADFGELPWARTSGN